jgi:hypothetical protein
MAAACVKGDRNLSHLTPAQVATFLASLADGSSVSAAARSIGYTRQRLYQLRAQDAELASAWAEAYEEGTDTFEDALNGEKKKGNIRAITVALACRRPEIWNPRVMIVAPDRAAAAPVTEALAAAETSATQGALTFRTAPQLAPPRDDDQAPAQDQSELDPSPAAADQSSD